MEVRERSTSSWSSGCTRVNPETPTPSASDRPNIRCADELPQATLPSSSTMTTLSGSFNMAPAREATSSIDGAASLTASAGGAETACSSAAEPPRAGACPCPRLFSRQVTSLLSDISAPLLVAIWLHSQEDSRLHGPPCNLGCKIMFGKVRDVVQLLEQVSRLERMPRPANRSARALPPPAARSGEGVAGKREGCRREARHRVVPPHCFLDTMRNAPALGGANEAVVVRTTDDEEPRLAVDLGAVGVVERRVGGRVIGARREAHGTIDHEMLRPGEKGDDGGQPRADLCQGSSDAAGGAVVEDGIRGEDR